MDTRLLSNIIPKENLRTVQTNVLKHASDAVMLTAGPYGSNTMILADNGGVPSYSKDGKKVLGKIKYYGPLENNIIEELHEIVTHVVAAVGDGTTSATRLSYYIFKELCNTFENDSDLEYPTQMIIKTFQEVTKEIQDTIRKNGREATTKDIFDICMISTNGNADVSNTIADIYGKYGRDVHISLGVSSTADHIIKEYDGLSLNKGYPSPAYINSDNDKCEIRNPKIYYFEDPIDTQEMVGFMSKIIYSNILDPMYKNMQMQPTVIFAPSISRDAQTMLTDIETMMYSGNKLPLLIVSNLNKYSEEIDDIAKLCGAPAIHKYIDPSLQKKDIEMGVAPTIENILDYCGGADLVVTTNSSTKVINPKRMFDTVGEGEQPKYSSIYQGMLEFLKKAIQSAQEEDDDMIKIGRLKKRLHTLQANMVEYHIGGVSMIDRDAIKDLAEDAILCCRSAINDGVGYGACYEGLNACLELLDTKYATINEKSLNYRILDIIETAYEDLIKELYATAMSKEEALEEVDNTIKNEMPINLRTLEYDGKVLTSIRTDVEILEAISKVVTIMFTANQGLIGDPMMNKYGSLNESDSRNKDK